VSPQAFRKKIERLEKEVVDLKGLRATTLLLLLNDLLSVEETLKLLAGALQAVEQSRLERN